MNAIFLDLLSTSLVSCLCYNRGCHSRVLFFFMSAILLSNSLRRTQHELLQLTLRGSCKTLKSAFFWDGGFNGTRQKHHVQEESKGLPKVSKMRRSPDKLAVAKCRLPNAAGNQTVTQRNQTSGYDLAGWVRVGKGKSVSLFFLSFLPRITPC